MRFITCCLLFTTVFACGKSDDSSTASKTWPELAGTWVSDCVAAGEMSVKGIRTYNDVSATLQVFYYADTSCTTQWAKIDYTSDFKVGDAVANSTTTKAIDYTTRSGTFTVTNAEAVDSVNSEKYYGHDDWKLNEARDILGKKMSESDDVEPVPGAIKYSLLKIDDKRLYSGNYDTGDGSTPEKRPTAVDIDQPLTKQ